MNHEDMVKELTEAQKNLPLNTCDICKQDNVPCFDGHPMTPTGLDQTTSKHICLQCFLKIGQGVEAKLPTAKERFIAHCPAVIKFILMNTRICFTITSSIVTIVCLFACLFELVLGQIPLAIAFAVLGWAICYISTHLVDQWHKQNKDLQNE